MGKGDKKTKKGKIAMGTYGRKRKQKDNKPQAANTKTQKASA